MSDSSRAVEYDVKVLQKWLTILREYVGDSASIQGKTVLELGPGPDLGIGILCLAEGAHQYNAIDVNNLVRHAPSGFYEALFERIQIDERYRQVDIHHLRSQLALTQEGRNDRINYVCNNDFDLSVFAGQRIDLVVSQAAFEHFDDVEGTISQLGDVVDTGALFVAEVDLRTHTRWIRDVDPLNIYRYSDFIYDLFRFRGSPNRIRPTEYRALLEKHGWVNVKVLPLTRLEGQYFDGIYKQLHSRFRTPDSQMDWLTVVICATKK